NNNFINTVSEHWLLLPFLSVFRTDLQRSVYDSTLSTEVILEFLKKFNLEKTFIEEQKKFLFSLYEPLLQNGFLYVLDKTPRYYEILNELTEYFPESKIIILIRDPVDVLLSIIQTWNIKSLRGLDYYARDILIAPLLLNKFCVEQSQNPNVIKLHYEDLVKKPETEIEQLFNRLNLQFNASILNYTKNDKTSGKRGDPSGVYLYKKIVSKDEKFIDTSITERIWKDFISGYKFYCKQQNMDNYSRYIFDDGKPGKTFKYYLKINTGNYTKRRLNITDYLIFLKTKLLSKNLRKSL
ncbi:MAG TPA: sulfotransferase, partial [Parafilimonas sp.]